MISLLDTIAFAYAVDASLQPGRYESAFGDLLIKRLPDNALSFKIISVGRTRHICDLVSHISSNQAQMNRHCGVRFRAHHRSIEVQSEGAGCAGYCGAGQENFSVGAKTFTVVFDVVEGCKQQRRCNNAEVTHSMRAFLMPRVLKKSRANKRVWKQTALHAKRLIRTPLRCRKFGAIGSVPTACLRA